MAFGQASYIITFAILRTICIGEKSPFYIDYKTRRCILSVTHNLSRSRTIWCLLKDTNLADLDEAMGCSTNPLSPLVIPQLYGATKPRQFRIVLPGINRLCSTGSGHFTSQTISKLHHWFKSFWWFWRIGGFCLLVEMLREGFVPAAWAAGLFKYRLPIQLGFVELTEGWSMVINYMQGA